MYIVMASGGLELNGRTHQVLPLVDLISPVSMNYMVTFSNR
jgi:hypothetical protein